MERNGSIILRKNYRAQMTKLCAKINELLEAQDVELKQINLNCEKVKGLKVVLKDLDEKILSTISEENLESECERITEYEMVSLDALSRAEIFIKTTSTVSSANLGSSNQATVVERYENSTIQQKSIKLPKLELMKFDGSLEKWPAFWEQFRTVIHENLQLDSNTKFSYLKNLVVGKAAVSISSIMYSPEAYKDAIELLKSEFGQTDRIIDLYIRKLYEVPAIKFDKDMLGLRRLYNMVKSIIQSLIALGISVDQFGLTVKSIVYKALPFNLKTQFNKFKVSEIASERESNDSSGSNSSATDYGKQIDELLRFIKIELDALELAKDSTVYKEPKTKNYDAERRIQRGDFTAQGLVALTKNNCLFCKSSKHEMKDCDNSSLDLEEKKKILKINYLCFRCTGAKHTSKFCKSRVSCKNCKGRHVTSMCDPTFKPKKENPVSTSSVTAISTTSIPAIYLKTATAYLKNNFNNEDRLIRILIDGGSQLTFIKREVPRKFNLPIVGKCRISICSFGNSNRGEAKYYNKVEVTLKNKFNDECITIEAIETPEICFDSLKQPSTQDPAIQDFARSNLLSDLEPPRVHITGISLLIGVDNYWSIVKNETIELANNLMAVNTIFGWTIHGIKKANDHNVLVNFNIANVLHSQITELNDASSRDYDIKKFWDLETIGIRTNESKNDDKEFTKKFLKNNVKLVNERYEVTLPWKNDKILDSNYLGALTRARNLVRKLCREEKLIEYDTTIREYMSLNCAELVTEDRLKIQDAYYLPHRPVYRKDRETTKVRVVFDASAHGPDMPSLNDKLLTGDNLVPDILKILLNFRLGRVGLVADIEKAFLQISLNESDRDFHRFLWFKYPVKEINSMEDLSEFSVFRMCRVTFGVTTSPFLLSVVLRKHLLSQSDKEFGQLLLDSFYVDDFIIAADSTEAALFIFKRSRDILAKASMNLRKWASNDLYLTKLFSEDKPSSVVKKVLGLTWNTASDELAVNSESILKETDISCRPTKRIVLKTIASIFDPLGILYPVTVKGKLLLQQIWKCNLDWDSELPDSLKSEWNQWLRNVDQLKDFCIDRCVIYSKNNPVQLHIFVDASPRAYGAVAYLRNNDSNNVHNKFLLAKSRVAPLKETLTLPKLELTAALCAARLQKYILENIELNVTKVFIWSDSKITLYWIKGENSRWKPYIQNRVNEIRQMKNINWRHCSGTDNPADLITRGLSSNKFMKESQLWLNGPTWLKLNETEWPMSNEIDEFGPTITCLIEKIDSENKGTLQPIFCLEKFHSLEKMLIVTAYVYRFIQNSRKKEVETKGRVCGKIKAEEMERSEIYWLKIVQQSEYFEEIKALKKKQDIPRKSSILVFTPFLDNDGLLRIGGRLQESCLDFQEKHPIILPKSSKLTEKLIWKAHADTFHCGVNTTLTWIRKRYWIIQGRQKIKSVISKCVICKKMRGKAGNAPFAPLPKDRITTDQPFKVTGIDFAGPLFVKTNVKEKSKVYIMILTCAVIRAVHLELVENLSTEHCLLALRRFIARRGVPQIIYSDNAKTFKRSALEIERLFTILKNDQIQEFSRKERIKWKFIAERAAWWGGFWERLIRSVKDSLKTVLKQKLIEFTELQTILAEVEAIINSRPLTYIDNDPTNLFILSPSKFLIGNTKTGLCLDFKLNVKRDIIVSTWKKREFYIMKLWKVWSEKYLSQLRSAYVNKNIGTTSFKVGDVVLLQDQDRPRMVWKLARIEKTFLGRDGRIRSCEVMTADKRLFRRPIQCLYPLEIQAGREDVEN